MLNCTIQNILLQSPQGVKYCVNCEEIEKETSAPPSSSRAQQQELLVAGSPSCKVAVDYQQVQCVLLTKLQSAVSMVQETNMTEVVIQQCHVIKACAEAIVAIRALKDTPT